MTTTVLVVDDHPGFLRAAAAVISASADFELAGTAGSGEDALEFLHDHDVDLVVIDLNLGEVDGIATAQAYAAAGGTARVVLMSTTDEQALPDDALDPPVAGFLAKQAFSTLSLDRVWAEIR